VGGAVVLAAHTGAGSDLSNRLKAQAYGIGFDLAGIARLGPASSAESFDDWLARGYAGDMEYLERGAAKRRDARLPFPGALSAVVVGLEYGGAAPSGPIARYARGDDYHDVMRRMLDSLHEWIESQAGRPVPGKSYVDTAPVLERDLARRAGLGWFGKNTNLINPSRGSFFFIGSLFLAIDLEPDAPFESDHCGTCTRCLDACPTGAFVKPRVLDATKCISYLTIEARGAVPVEHRESVGSLLYGCDICQDVCPWNRKFATEAREPAFAERAMFAGKSAREIARNILSMNDEEFRGAFRGSAMKRAKLRGLKRNAAVVLGNSGTADDTDVLGDASHDPDPLVREHAEWALTLIAAASGAQ
jgi:epoxyqueuosine reductase